MPKLPRVLLTQFGINGPTDDFAKFGSQTAGSPVKTKDIALIQTLDAWVNGWKDAIVAANKAPYLEDMNSLFLVHSYELSYLFQEGIPEWQTATTYYIGSIVKKASTSELYASLVDNNTGNALPSQTDDGNWKYLSTTQIPAGNTASRPATPPSGFIYLNTEVHVIQRFNGATYDNIAVVPDASITEVQLSASVAGAGLVGGAGTALAVNPDNVTIEISSDAVRLKDLGITSAKLAANAVGATSKILDNIITTPKMVANAISSFAAVNFSVLTTGGFSLLQSTSIAVDGPDSVIVVFASMTAGGVSTAGGLLDFRIAIIRGASFTGNFNIPGAYMNIGFASGPANSTQNYPVCCIGIETGLAAGTYSYKVGGTIVSGTGFGAGNISLIAMQLKK